MSGPGIDAYRRLCSPPRTRRHAGPALLLLAGVFCCGFLLGALAGAFLIAKPHHAAGRTALILNAAGHVVTIPATPATDLILRDMQGGRP